MINSPERRAVVMDAAEIDLIDYSEIIERDVNDLVYSFDSSQVYIQYDEPDVPSFLSSLTYMEGPYDYNSFQTILSNSRWSGQDSALDDTSGLQPVFF